MNLPAYSNLQYPSNAIYYAGQGIRGVYVFNTGVATILKLLPNQALSACSTMTLKGINVVCSCDNNEYSLFTGLSQGGSQYPLKQYRVEWDYSQSL
jgi:hypothetical protein